MNKMIIRHNTKATNVDMSSHFLKNVPQADCSRLIAIDTIVVYGDDGQTPHMSPNLCGSRKLKSCHVLHRNVCLISVYMLH